jgi:hypothetical protein
MTALSPLGTATRAYTGGPRHALPPPLPRHEPVPHGIPREDPAPGTAGPLPPLGGWRFHDPQPSRNGWHIACPCCLEGRVLIAPEADDYALRPDTCTLWCPPRDVMRWYAVREGDMRIFFRWLEAQRPTRRAA